MTRSIRFSTMACALILLSSCSGVERLTGRRVIVDMQGVDPAAYQEDLAACEAYADEVDVARQTAAGTVTGAVVGAVAGAAVGNSTTASRGAGLGATTGTLGGASRGLSERAMVVRNCLLGRGYNVLN